MAAGFTRAWFSADEVCSPRYSEPYDARANGWADKSVEMVVKYLRSVLRCDAHRGLLVILLGFPHMAKNTFFFFFITLQPRVE